VVHTQCLREGDEAQAWISAAYFVSTSLMAIFSSGGCSERLHSSAVD
jgi:hypothetical protein